MVLLPPASSRARPVPTAQGVEKTLRTLLRSANPAASELLTIALESDEPSLRVGAVRTLALRDDAAGHRALVENYQHLPADAREAINVTPHRAPLVGSLIEMLKPGTPRLARRAAEMVHDWQATLALPAVAEAVLWADDDSKSFYATEALCLTGLLEQAMKDYEATAGSAKESRPEDPAFQRRAAVNALAKGVERYESHQCPEVVDAFLRLTPCDEPTLVEALHNTSHPAHRALLETLRHSDSEGALGVLASVLLDLHAPEGLLLVAAERCDRQGLTILLCRLGFPIGARARVSVARVPGFAWLESGRMEVLLRLPEQAQATAMQIAAASGSSRKLLAEAIELLLERGEPAGRAAAADAIESLKDQQAHPPLSRALLGGDTTVLPTVARLLRAKNYPDATAILILLLDYEDESVVEAAQRALGELSFSQFRNQIDELPPDHRRRLGRLIAKADPNVAATLALELKSGAAERRLRTLDLIELMGLAGDLAPVLLQRVAGDPDVGVRAEAAGMLGAAPKLPSVLETLEEALDDDAHAVREAARASLQKLLGQPLIPIEAS
ncbi:hypothetical protein MalM25_16150 [Planctomycetes bacterium MalM25]|nr:hypothetical protein MalM25_16150 [Planctomycetes bacterium MalM25]